MRIDTYECALIKSDIVKNTVKQGKRSMFKRFSDNPIIPRRAGTFYSIHVANPDILEFNNKILMYFRGQSDERHDQIGIAYIEPENFNGITWKHYEGNPVIKVSKDESAFDCRHIVDPASVIIDDKVFLYYSGHSYNGPACIGLAVSEDGFNFKKHDVNPVIEGAIAAEVVVKDGMVHLFYQRKLEKDVYNFYCTTSTDGVSFDTTKEKRVFTQSDSKGTFDEVSITTGRIWLEEDTYFMTYCGCDKFADYPLAIGLAKSKELFNWKRYPGNPIFKRGEAGEWDEGALWFGTVYKHKETYYMWYEGTGAGLGTDTEEAIAASELCRNSDYGGYADISFSQTGLATYSGDIPKW